MSGKIYEKNHLVKYYECDTTQKIALPMLFNILLHTSGEQSYHLGVGDEAIAEHGLSWIVLQHDMQVNRLPHIYETIKITTQALSYNKLFCYRQFEVYDEQDNLCLTVDSTFALMNFRERKMARIPEELVRPYEAEFSKKLVRTPKPVKIDVSTASSADYRVRYLDIDSNRHVNNSKYIDWAIDPLGQEFLTTHEVKRFTMKFEKEVHYGNQIASQTSLSELEDGKVVSAHRIMTEETVNCEASIVWAKKSE